MAKKKDGKYRAEINYILFVSVDQESNTLGHY